MVTSPSNNANLVSDLTAADSLLGDPNFNVRDTSLRAPTIMPRTAIRCRRLAKDYEEHTENAGASVQIAMIHLMLKPLTASATGP